MRIREIQREQAEWSLQNFGRHPSWQPLLGVQEELGELSHAFLKREQGIRGTREEHDANIRDAVADMVIFLSDFCTCEGFYVPDLIHYVTTQRPTWTKLLRIQVEVGRLAEHHTAVRQQHVNDVVVALMDFCASENINLRDQVWETWQKVRQRDWTKDKMTGGA